MKPTWETTPRAAPLAVVPALDDPLGRHLTERGLLALCLRTVPEGAPRDHALGPHGCSICVARAQALGHICPCRGRPLTIPVMPDGLCLDCATTEAGQRYRADEAARQERICPACQQPILQVDADGQCQVCVTKRTRGW
jgi:hypothetical protein